jgi:DNA polymerase elongation subunit (family B)
MNGTIHKLPSESFKKFLIKEQVSLSQAGVMYSQKTKGVIPNLIDQIYTERVEIKSQMSLLKKELAKVKEAIAMTQIPYNEMTLEELTALETKMKKDITYLDNQNLAIKVLLNSIYGTFANKHSSLMDIDNATSITMTGQSVARAGGYILDEYVNRVYGIKETITKYGDTDSIDGDTIIQTNLGSLPIETLYENFKDSKRFYTFKGHEIVDIENKHIKVPTFYSDKNIASWGRVKNIIRHKVSKKKYKIVAGGKEVVMTEDHGCMVLRDGKLIRIAPADINVKTDKMIVLKQ